MKTIIKTFLFLSILIFIACDKDDEPGPQGLQGPQGATGLQGEPGSNGNANVFVTKYSLGPNDWVLNGSNRYIATVTDTQITQSIVDSGMVSVFYFINSTANWTPLPYNQLITYPSTVFNNWTFFYQFNQIKFRIEGNVGPPANPGFTDFKVIVIPASQKSSNPKLDFSDLKEIKAKFK